MRGATIGGMKARVLLADDHGLVRAGLSRLLTQAGFAVVAEAENGEEARKKALEMRPDLIFWDLLMPEGGFAGLQRLRESLPEAKILVLTALDGPGLAEEARRAGAAGLVVKTANPEEIVRAAEAALRGVFAQPSTLTPREREVIALFGEGLRIPEIAEKLKISEKTVETHLEKLKEKLGFGSITELRAWAIRARTPTEPGSQG